MFSGWQLWFSQSRVLAQSCCSGRSAGEDQIFEGEESVGKGNSLCGHVGQHSPTSNSVKGILRLRAACFLYASQILCSSLLHRSHADVQEAQEQLLRTSFHFRSIQYVMYIYTVYTDVFGRFISAFYMLFGVNFWCLLPDT